MDREYLFFAAWSYQAAEYGMEVPTISCEYEDALPLYEASLGTSGTVEFDFWSTVYEVYWPDEFWPENSNFELQDLLMRYGSEPQLYFSELDVDHDDEQFFINIRSALVIPNLESDDLRNVIVDSVRSSMTDGDNGLSEIILRLLVEPGVLRN